MKKKLFFLSLSTLSIVLASDSGHEDFLPPEESGLRDATPVLADDRGHEDFLPPEESGLWDATPPHESASATNIISNSAHNTQRKKHHVTFAPPPYSRVPDDHHRSTTPTIRRPE